ncbi:MAG: 6,7-dimethyl-8-ribityllumazine synthase [Candidatus Magasanikbacteria bacterium GW2011_GWC2_34_16]|uniref:6,7-dimethyl-8-ribityllumazine synthase n=2 Tax=Candidatus Magasanikiibacteriota TaxID=1752731 RepID=A0A0G0HLB5_9BACT|nr:MAG: 6,7-dimethyl-8-ribityllumazine synthase [Candidatus Magasanikbacteria bacterium GW2011_GWC2_34_16]KKQ39355.1 MAG: 6,7-dimethyl-8-ribityllumazine synthase [Candidatus Magasanikbacteria bacterium GW2011_GWA2_37_8]
MKNNEYNFEPFDASKYRVGIVCARFNNEFTDKILDSAVSELKKYKISADKIDIKYVAGSVEILIVLQKLAKTKKYNCLLAVGAVIRGQTDHYGYVCKIVCEGVLRVMLDYSLPIGFAVLTVQNKKLAKSRISIGAQAVTATMQNINILGK